MAAPAPPPAASPPRKPAAPWPEAVGRAVVRQVAVEFYGAPGYSLTLALPKADEFASTPRDFRPTDPGVGRAAAAGRFYFAGELLDAAAPADPWGATPSRAFAVELHRFAWLPHLMAAGDLGVKEALRLVIVWRKVFGKWSPFVWGREVLARRVFNLACAVRRLAQAGDETVTPMLADLLARQARHLVRIAAEPASASADAGAAAAIAGCALTGRAGERLMAQGLARLERSLPRTICADGSHATRSPEAGLELLFDCLTLDDALLQRGREAPDALSRAIDRMSLALRAYTLGDGRLACFQGGEASTMTKVAAAGAHEDAEAEAPQVLADGAYHRLQGQMLQVMVDAGAPARGVFGAAACAQPLALEVVCGRDRLITNCGWSAREPDRQGFRLTPAGSTLSVGDASVLQPLEGRLAAILGPRLAGGPLHVEANRQAGEGAVLLELQHDGWVRRFGLVHERSLYIDIRADELRGEDRLVPQGPPKGHGAPFAVRFHLHPDVQVSMARDRKSVLLRGPSGRGWWLRCDAHDVAVEPSAWFENGVLRRASQIALRGVARADTQTRVRWKIAPAGGGETQLI
ncbi:MAG TPA: heparinase II/III family protein [Caulobacteraceae bacterium]|jgi:uncharacterized heparinase superfamily protein